MRKISYRDCSSRFSETTYGSLKVSTGCASVALRRRRLLGVRFWRRGHNWLLLLQEFCRIQQRTAQRRIVPGPRAIGGSFAFEMRPHAFHLGIEVVEIMQHQSLGEHALRQLWRTEFIFPMMTDDEVLDQDLKFVGEVGELSQFGLQHFQFDDHVAEQLAARGIGERAVISKFVNLLPISCRKTCVR